MANPFQPDPWGDGDVPALSLCSHQGSGCCQLHREEKQLSPLGYFALGAVNAPPPLFHSNPWPPGGKTASDTQTCLGNLPVQGACCPLGVPCPVICCGGRGAEAPLWADTSLGRGPHFLQHSCRWGAGAGRGPPREGFCASLCHCVVFSAAGPS